MTLDFIPARAGLQFNIMVSIRGEAKLMGMISVYNSLSEPICEGSLKMISLIIDDNNSKYKHVLCQQKDKKNSSGLKE
jgi:hypothetical protein